MPPRAQSKKKTPAKPSPTEWPGLKDDKLANLSARIKTHFDWEHEPRQFQLDAIKAQLQRKDVVIHAGTGSGKTVVAAGPHVYDEVKGMVTFMVAPLIVLQDEHVSTFIKECKLTAIAVNSSNEGCTSDVMKKICAGEWQIVVISPEMLLSKRFIKHVIRNKDFAHRILSFVIDEAHVVSLWGADFRKRYASLGILRALLPKSTPMVAMSATLTPRVRRDMLRKLQYPTSHLDLNIGNDRPNVSLVVRAFEHPMNTFVDLAFLIPDGVKEPKDIKKTFLYADDISVAAEIEDYLYSRCPADWRRRGLAILPYSAAFSPEYRAAVMVLFLMGIVRILICTDAAGMGCNIPDIDVVVQWKLPGSLSSLVQRMGRAARGTGRVGLGILLAERSVYSADLTSINSLSKLTSDTEKKKKRTVRQSSDYPKGRKGYAAAHGVERGSYGGQKDQVPAAEDVPIDFDAIDEGLYSYVQTSSCRRALLTKVYQNQPAEPTVPCCDICEPSLFDLTRPGKHSKPKRKAAVVVGEMNEMVRENVRQWRRRIWERDHGPLSQFGASAILKNETIDRIASVGPIENVLELERLLDGWMWFGQYGDSLLALLKSLPIPPMVPISKEAKAVVATKRKAAAADAAGGGGQRKRARVEGSTDNELPAPVTGASFHTTSSSSTSMFLTFSCNPQPPPIQQTPPHPSTPSGRTGHPGSASSSHSSPFYHHLPPHTQPYYTSPYPPSRHMSSDGPLWGASYPPQLTYAPHSSPYYPHYHHQQQSFMPYPQSHPIPYPGQPGSYSSPLPGSAAQSSQQSQTSTSFVHYNPPSEPSQHQ